MTLTSSPTSAAASAAPSARPHFSLCVYCGSRPGEDAGFTTLARAVGTWIGNTMASSSMAAGAAA